MNLVDFVLFFFCNKKIHLLFSFSASRTLSVNSFTTYFPLTMISEWKIHTKNFILFITLHHTTWSNTPLTRQIEPKLTTDDLNPLIQTIFCSYLPYHCNHNLGTVTVIISCKKIQFQYDSINNNFNNNKWCLFMKRSLGVI